MDEQEIAIAGEQKSGTATIESEGVAEGESPEAQASTEEPEANAEETLTQSQVNDIVRERLARQAQSAYERYGVGSREELDALVEHAKAYDALAESETKARLEVARLAEELALLKNGIGENRYDDVRTWFKGKGLDLTGESLKEALATHPEWSEHVVEEAPKAHVSPIGTSAEHAPKADDEDAIASKYFGLKSFVR